MAIHRELILELRDIDRISMQCTSCRTRVSWSLRAMQPIAAADVLAKPSSIPGKCPSCDAEWANIHGTIKDCCDTLRKLAEYEVAFHAQELTAAKGE